MKFELDNLRCHLVPPNYEGFFRAHDLVLLRAELRHPEAVQAVNKLRKLQLRSLGAQKSALTDMNNTVDPTGRFEQTIINLEAAEIWKIAARSNPPSGTG
jgi:hypothetical protein